MAVRQGIHNPRCLSVGNLQQLRYVAPREFSSVEDRLKNLPRPRRKRAQSALILRPRKNACSQLIRLHELFHEIDLVDTSLEKELSEAGQRFFTEMTSAIQVIATR